MDKYAIVYEAVFDNFVNDEITLEEFKKVTTLAFSKYLTEAKVEYLDKRAIRQNNKVENITRTAQYAKLSRDINNLYDIIKTFDLPINLDQFFQPVGGQEEINFNEFCSLFQVEKVDENVRKTFINFIDKLLLL